MKKGIFGLLCLFLLFPVIMKAGKPHSVLSSGKWYRVGVVQTGMHRITYDDFTRMGFDPPSFSATTIRIFGNGGSMLPEKNSSPRPDDLTENSIRVIDGGDNRLDPGDYVIFYGEGPVTWSLNPAINRFSHILNLYSDTSWYFVTAGGEPGTRVTDRESLPTTPTYFVSKFADYDFHEAELFNLIKSGKNWLGESFSATSTIAEFPFVFPEINNTVNLKVTLHFVGYSMKESVMLITDNNGFSDTVVIPPVSVADNPFAVEVTKSFFIPNPGSGFTLKIEYLPGAPDARAWLDKFDLNFFRNLTWRNGSQMLFRDPSAIGKSCAEFRITNTHPGMEIWEVTKRDDVRRVISVNTDSTMRFRMASDSLREYVAFDYSGFYSVILDKPVANQDLHAALPSGMVIITHPLFAEQAQRLAAFHNQKEGMQFASVYFPEEIYNEYSSGKQDPAALRDFIRHLYEKSGGVQPRYLLLFGDGTYDPKNRIPGNNNLIPTFQSKESVRSTASFLCDDFYGLMEADEGEDAEGSIEVSTGRLPVSTPEEARIMVDKIIHYSTESDSVQDDWRNRMTFLADDEDGNLHFQQAELVTRVVKEKYPVINVQKIYNDAYKMIPTPSGDRLPQVNEAINRAINEGTLFFNYNGHGGEDGLAAEKVLTVPDIESWTNYDRLPVFVTATCEFSRFDNPERYTAGERVLSHPNGGGIALFSTTRLSFASSNIKLDTSFFSNLNVEEGRNAPRLGDLLRLSKNENGNKGSIKNFTLLGDPAQKISYPNRKVVTTSVQTAAGIPQDTALGLSKVRITGEVTDGQGVRVPMTGKISVRIYDKPAIVYTIGNHPPASYPAPFQTQTSLLYKGSTSVTEGTFAFDFLVPGSVAPALGNAKISYYAEDGQDDGAGYDHQLVVGGQDPSVDPVNAGPDIVLYMDKPTFKSGDRTGRNTILFADISDNDGINTLGLGLGHEITATIDNDESGIVILNDAFVFDGFSQTSGSVQLPLDLIPGYHTAKVKAWDLFDNSSENEIGFWVTDPGVSAFTQTYCYPNPYNNSTGEAVFRILFSRNGFPGTIAIRIYSQTGNLVRTINREYPGGIPEQVEIRWDGTSQNGSRLKAGLYLYQVVLPAENGGDESVSQKVVILN